MPQKSLKERIASHGDIRVAVIGIGYVGLPLAVRMAHKGLDVLGVDINPDVIAHLKNGKSTVEMVNDTQIQEVVRKTQKLKLVLVNRETDKTSRKAIRVLRAVDAFIVCADTPLDAEHGWAPDIRWIKKSAELIKRVLNSAKHVRAPKKELLILLESTSYPGTTRDVFLPLVNAFKGSGPDIYLAYSPERTNPGLRTPSRKQEKGSNPFTITRILGTLDKPSREVALALYAGKRIFSRVRPVESLEAAEMIKLVENTFRFVSIAFANEMALAARLFGLNIWELLTAVRTKKFGLELCYPGLIGGHCIPIDPHYLAWAIHNRKKTANLIDVAQRAHDNLKKAAINLIIRLLNKKGKCVLGASILFMGVAYKKNIGDIRESAILVLMKHFASYGARIFFWDPLVNGGIRKPIRLEFSSGEIQKHARILKNHAQWRPSDSSLMPSELSGTWDQIRDTCLSSQFDCIVLGADHDCFSPAYMEFDKTSVSAIADLCDAFRSSADSGYALKEKLASVRKKLAEEDRYMLLGVD
jgi:UDP-N-acetyl-D-glucosamine dehydrogenase